MLTPQYSLNYFEYFIIKLNTALKWYNKLLFNALQVIFFGEDLGEATYLQKINKTL